MYRDRDRSPDVFPMVGRDTSNGSAMGAGAAIILKVAKVATFCSKSCVIMVSLKGVYMQSRSFAMIPSYFLITAFNSGTECPIS